MTAPTHLTLESFLSQLRYACAVFGTDKKLINSSPRFSMFFPLDEVGASYTEIFTQTPELVRTIDQVLEQKAAVTLYETMLPLESGGEVFNVEIFPLMSTDKANLNQVSLGVGVSLLDVNSQSFFSEQKKRHDALARVGLIASGLAHEIKNPLSGLKGAAQLILTDLGDAKRLTEYAHIIVKESERINRLVQELLNFTKPKELRRVGLNIHKVLHEVMQTVACSQTKNVVLKEVFDPSLPDITGDEDALKQVFLNLIKNSADAVQNNGTVRIKSQFVTDFTLKTSEKKRHIICVQIEDDGCGMSEDQIKNIFTPYYTTKEKGTGLGLAIVNQLVELHGGSVAVKSKLGEGTQFSIYLPV